MKDNILISGCSDVFLAFKKLYLILTLGWQDMNLRYRRSSLGPFWITISMGINIATIGLVFGQIFAAKMNEFLPFLSIGLIVWGYVSGVIQDGCTAFTSAEGIIKQIDLPMFFHVLRMVWRNFLFFLHNAVIIPLTFLIMMRGIGFDALLFIPGFLVLSANITWMSIFCGVFCTRFRDLPQIVTSILMVFFYLTPIMWMPSLLPQRAALYLLDLNPFFHLLEIVRAPLMGSPTTMLNWLVSLGMALVGWLLAVLLLGRYKDRIAYWL